jgi:hypothetical protein
MIPEQQLGRVLLQLSNNFGEIRAFRRVAHLGIPLAKDPLKQEAVMTYRALYEKELENKTIKGIDGIAHESMNYYLRSAEGAVDVASLVFSHSVLDAAAFNLLRVTFSVAPSDWEVFVRKKQVTFDELKDSDYDRLLTRLGFNEVQKTDRQLSLPDKGARLLQLARPENDWDIPFKYDDAELRRIDELRHEIIHDKHGIGNLLRIPDIEQTLDFLQQTGMYLFHIVKKRYFRADVDLTTC